MDNYKNALVRILEHEGGYVNNINDSGGETIFGISRNNHPDLYMWSFIDIFKLDNDLSYSYKRKQLEDKVLDNELCLNEIKKLYREYYDGIKGDLIKNYRVMSIIFDMAVNAGVKQASKLAQRVVNVDDDGIIGNKSITAINNYEPSRFVRSYALQRIRHYINITKTKPSNIEFMYGWIKRTIDYI